MKDIINVLKNSLPKYSIKQPSSQDTILIYRPFTVKEEKSLLLSKDTGSYTDFLITISELISACYNIDAKKLPIFDVEYMFLKLREKSVSETVVISFDCPTTGERIKNIEVRLNEIEVKKQENSKNIKLSNELIVNMRYPTFEFLIENTTKSNNGNIDLYDMVLYSIESIQTPDELITNESLSSSLLNEFIENLTRTQYELILNFFLKAPKIEHEVYYTTKDGMERKIILRGIRDFFR